MTDYRALCAELLEFAENLTKHYYQPAELVTRARAAITQPEPAGEVTDEELIQQSIKVGLAFQPQDDSPDVFLPFDAEEPLDNLLIAYGRAAIALAPVQPFIPAELIEISQRLRTQDNRATADTIFLVRGRRRVCGMDPAYAELSIWMDSSEWTEVPEPEDPDNPPEGIVQVFYTEVWDVLKVAFTEEGCKEHLRINGHNYRSYEKVEIYADSLWRCPEMLAIRQFLLSLTDPERRASVQPADGDVAELVAMMKREADCAESSGHLVFMEPADMAEAAALIQHPQPPQPVAEALAARALLESVLSRMKMAGMLPEMQGRISAWLADNPPGQPVAIEPRGCPTPGACSCIEPQPVAVSERHPDTARLDALRDQSWDLRCFDMPTGEGDADVGWRVIQHHMAPPHERVVAEVYEDDPRAAIDAAMNTPTTPPEAP